MMLLFCVFVALAFADDVTRLQLNTGTLYLTSPWKTPGALVRETSGQHYYSNLPTDFYSLPYRYGFRVSGDWLPYTPVGTGFTPNYVAPNTAWLRLCDAVPVNNDDFNVVIQGFGEATGAPEACPSKCLPPNFVWTIEALQADGVTTQTVATPSVVKDAAANNACLDNRVVVNMATLRKANPGASLFIKVVNVFGVRAAQPAAAAQACINPTRTCPTATPYCNRLNFQCTTTGAGAFTVNGVSYQSCLRSETCPAAAPICAPAPAATLPTLSGSTICQPCTSDSQCATRAYFTSPTAPAASYCLANGQCNALTGVKDNIYEFRVQRVGTTWDNIKSCSYTTSSNLVFAECKAIAADFVTCANGLYEPANEECDIGLDPVGCTPSCTCLQPRVADGTGKCSFCGNGAVEQLQGEKCDRGTDANCSTDCKSCVAGFALNAANKCTQCGNGVADSGEACDYVIDPVRCSTACSCPAGYVGNGRGGCTLCGNGVLDLGEVCDNKFPNCNTECTGCASPFVARSALVDPTGACTLCGNGVLDAGEKCDWKNDYNCNPDCSGCSAYHNIVNGMCSRCGNGYLDAGEKCDSLRDDCARDCQSCVNGRTPANDKWGNCGGCGNGVVDADEVCDTGIDGDKCAPDCGSCQHPYTSVGRRCVTCGNGRLDTVRDADGTILFVEVCDAAQPGCRDDCSACEAGWDASEMMDGTCVPQCDACCEALAFRTGATTDDEVDSASTLAVSFAFFGLLATLL